MKVYNKRVKVYFLKVYKTGNINCVLENDKFYFRFNVLPDDEKMYKFIYILNFLLNDLQKKIVKYIYFSKFPYSIVKLCRELFISERTFYRVQDSIFEKFEGFI